jgi:hypothetical protein
MQLPDPLASVLAAAQRLFGRAVDATENVVGDRPGFHDEPVDSSIWLLARQLLLEVPFEERFTRGDAENLVGEDDKMFWALIAKGEPMAWATE